ncbi:MAG: transporter [Salinibacter sp.]
MTCHSSFDLPRLPSTGGAIVLALLMVGLLVPGQAAAQGFPEGSPAVSPSGDVARHEPIFGRGPRTLWQGGYGIGMGVERTDALREQHWALDYHLSYGITERWMAIAELHQESLGEGAAFGSFGNLRVHSKYRFYLHNVPGGVYHAAVVGGVSLPTGTAEHSPDATDVVGGLSGAYEGRRWLLFTTARYRLNTQGDTGIRRGDVVLYDLALGLRPVLTGYYQPDVVLMGELNGEIFQSSSPAGPVLAGEDHHGQVGPGGHRLRAGFGAWITYRNWAVKPGIQIPLYNGLDGGRKLDYHAVLEVEVHF